MNVTVTVGPTRLSVLRIRAALLVLKWGSCALQWAVSKINVQVKS